jgi:hypothetical protein
MNKKFHIVFPVDRKKINIIGYSVVLAYTIVILAIWIHSDVTGHTYFTAGEPNAVIKYTEWVLGFFGIIVVSMMFKKECESKDEEYE